MWPYLVNGGFSILLENKKGQQIKGKQSTFDQNYIVVITLSCLAVQINCPSNAVFVHFKLQFLILSSSCFDPQSINLSIRPFSCQLLYILQVSKWKPCFIIFLLKSMQVLHCMWNFIFSIDILIFFLYPDKYNLLFLLQY